MNRHFVVLATACVLAIAVVACGRSQANAVDAAAPASGPPIDVAAADLAIAYKTNRALADTTYKGKRVRVSGVVGDVRKGNGPASITLGREGDAESVAECFFADDFAKPASSLTKGMRLTLECDCEGLATNVVLRRCGFGARAPAASASASLDGKGSMDVCNKLEAAGVAAKCRAVEGTGERVKFEAVALPGKGGLVTRLADDALFGKYVAGLASQPPTSPLLPYQASAGARIVVHLPQGVTQETQDKVKAVLDAL